MRYDRKILVPYLANVYRAELTERSMIGKLNEVTDKAKSIEQKINTIEYYKNLNIAKPYKKKSDAPLLLCFLIIFIIILIVLVKYLKGTEAEWLAYFIMCPGIILMIVLLASDGSRVSTQNNKVMVPYNEKCQNKQYWLSQESAVKSEYSKVLSLRNNIKHDIKCIADAKRKLYAANVIPDIDVYGQLKFRSAEGAYFLYKYFSTSQSADDLDQVIQTFVLSDIAANVYESKRYLESIMCNQNELMYAVNELNDEINRNSIETRKQLAQIEHSNAERNNSLQMIYQEEVAQTDIQRLIAAKYFFNR